MGPLTYPVAAQHCTDRGVVISLPDVAEAAGEGPNWEVAFGRAREALVAALERRAEAGHEFPLARPHDPAAPAITLSEREADALMARAGDTTAEDQMTNRIIAETAGQPLRTGFAQEEPADQVELSPGHWIEAQHVAHVFLEGVEMHVAGHPAIRQTPRLSVQADTAVEALADLYQAIGALAPEARQA